MPLLSNDMFWGELLNCCVSAFFVPQCRYQSLKKELLQGSNNMWKCLAGSRTSPVLAIIITSYSSFSKELYTENLSHWAPLFLSHFKHSCMIALLILLFIFQVIFKSFWLQGWNLKKWVALKSFYHPDYGLLWSLPCVRGEKEEFKIQGRNILLIWQVFRIIHFWIKNTQSGNTLQNVLK